MDGNEFASTGFSLKQIHLWPATMHALFRILRSVVLDCFDHCRKDDKAAQAKLSKHLLYRATRSDGAALKSRKKFVRVDNLVTLYKDMYCDAFSLAPKELRAIAASLKNVTHIIYHTGIGLR